MKHIVTGLACMFIAAKGFTQVAISSSNQSPHASAMLEIKSSSKGLLIPRIYLTSLVDGTTIPAPATALLVYNTNAGLGNGTGFYYNAGTSASPNWKALSDITLPFYKATSDTGPAFRIENYNPAATSSAVYAMSTGGTALVAESNTGNALEVKGKIKIAGQGQSPAAGKVLTSDAAGNASWQGAVAFSASGIPEGGSAEIAPGQLRKVAYLNENYDYGNNFNPSTVSPHSTFTAPVNGIYHFDAQFAWEYSGSDFRSNIYLIRERNGVTSVLVEQETRKETGNTGNQVSKDCELLAGDKVWVQVQITGTSNRLLYTHPDNNYFNGHLFMRL